MELILLFMKRHPSIRIEFYTVKDSIVVKLKLATFMISRILYVEELSNKEYLSYILPTVLEDMARKLYNKVDE